jgi:hypothetical protein
MNSGDPGYASGMAFAANLEVMGCILVQDMIDMAVESSSANLATGHAVFRYLLRHADFREQLSLYTQSREVQWPLLQIA